MSWVVLDGFLHRAGESECCSILGRRCRCGGFVHITPCYGGLVEACESCEPDAWSNEPEPPTDEIGAVIEARCHKCTRPIIVLGLATQVETPTGPAYACRACVPR